MRKGCLAALALLVAVVVGMMFWCNRTGTFSHANYKRIQPGMTVAEVEHLLGGPGAEVSEQYLPRIANGSVSEDLSKRLKAVVAGEHYIRWEYGPMYILVSLRGGVVAEKYYYEPSF